MKSRLLILIPVGWFFVNLGWAATPVPVPAKGGLPECEAELAVCNGDFDSCDVALGTCVTDLTMCDTALGTCNTDLTATEGLLQVCEDALAQCQATAFPATGQTSCWFFDGTVYVQDIDCTNPASAGQDGDIQAGADLSYDDTGLTIIDNNTKLEWMKQDDNNLGCGSYPDNLDEGCRFTWDEAFAFVVSLNANNHAGYTDWRLPNAKELESIRYYEGNPEDIAIRVSEPFHSQCVAGCTLETPCSCTCPCGYWSSTTSAFDPVRAWIISFGSGPLTNPRDKTFHAGRVRAVRGGL